MHLLVCEIHTKLIRINERYPVCYESATCWSTRITPDFSMIWYRHFKVKLSLNNCALKGECRVLRFRRNFLDFLMELNKVVGQISDSNIFFSIGLSVYASNWTDITTKTWNLKPTVMKSWNCGRTVFFFFYQTWGFDMKCQNHLQTIKITQIDWKWKMNSHFLVYPSWSLQ